MKEGDSLFRKPFERIETGSLIQRLIGYIVLFIVISFFIMFMFILADFKKDFSDGNSLFLILTFLPSLLLILLLEISTQKNRRADGYPFWENIEEHIKQRTIDEDAEIRVQYHDNTVLDEDDLKYWFKLKEKGDISDEEYEVKKSELMKIENKL